MIVKRVPIDTYCEKKVPTLQKTYDGLIDYLDISSVDNAEKRIISYQTIRSSNAPSRAKQLLKKGDVLVSTVRPNLNAVAVVEEETENLMVGSTGYCVLRCKENIDVRYLFNFCQSQYFIDDMSSQATGASYPAVSNSIVRNSLIPCHSIEEQRKIAEKIDTVSELIAFRKQQLVELDELVKSRFIELFGLPVSNSKGWNTEKMREVAPTVNYSGGFEDTVWLLILDMEEAQTGRILDYLYVNEEEVGNSTCTFDTTNVLYSKLRPYLNKVVIPDRCGYATSELIPLKPNPMKLERTYLAFMLRSDEFVNMINEKVAGAKMPRVSMSDFREFDVPVPPMELQKQFDAFGEQTDKSKLAVQQSITELEELKKSLMQKYFG